MNLFADELAFFVLGLGVGIVVTALSFLRWGGRG